MPPLAQVLADLRTQAQTQPEAIVCLSNGLALTLRQDPRATWWVLTLSRSQATPSPVEVSTLLRHWPSPGPVAFIHVYPPPPPGQVSLTIFE